MARRRALPIIIPVRELICARTQTPPTGVDDQQQDPDAALKGSVASLLSLPITESCMPR